MRCETVVRILAVAVTMLSTSTVVFARHPPGYVWGLANCGIGNTCSRTACETCCERAGQNGDIDPDEVYGCKRACEDIIFEGQCPGLIVRFFAWILA